VAPVLKVEGDPMLEELFCCSPIVHHRGLEFGFALLPKPITPATLLHNVRDVLDARRAAPG
jgi:hypothetical protein